MKYILYLSFTLIFSLLTSCTAEKSVEAEEPAIPVIDPEAEFHGIDVSHHNGHIDWERVAQNPNVKFVYVKATEGATHIDKKYKEFFEGAKKAGFKVGSYHFFRMTSSPQAQFENIKTNILKDEQDLIVMIDVETTDKHPIKETRDSLRKLLNLVEEYYGVKPMIYGTNRSYNQICGNTFNNHPLYLGRYGSNPPIIKGIEHYSIWQYSEKGKIDGISKPVDLCKFHPDVAFETILYTPPGP